MQPPDGKKRVVFALIPIIIFLGISVSFFWPILKEFNHARQNGNHGSIAPLMIFGGFFLLVILMLAVSVVRGSHSKPGLYSLAGERSPEAKPWLAREDWAAGCVKSSGLGPMGA